MMRRPPRSTLFPYRRSSDLKRPSEYIRSGRIYFNCEGGEITLPYALERIGHQAVLFASDFPHETNRSEEHTSELQSHSDLVCRLLLEKKKTITNPHHIAERS